MVSTTRWHFRPVTSLSPSKPRIPLFPSSSPTGSRWSCRSAWAPYHPIFGPRHGVRRESSPACRPTSSAGSGRKGCPRAADHVGHRSPGDAASQYIQEAVHHFAQRVRTWAPPFRGITLQQREKPLPLRIGQVGWVSMSVYTNELHPVDLAVSQHALTAITSFRGAHPRSRSAPLHISIWLTELRCIYPPEGSPHYLSSSSVSWSSMMYSSSPR